MALILQKSTKKITIFMAVFIVLFCGVIVYTQNKSLLVSAANLSHFDPGNIISDSVMSNKDAMSVQDIQTFLDSKNPCNNTNIHLAKNYPHLQYTIRNGKFICMAQDIFDGETAAQIIWQAAQDYSINPRVLIVLLEKEQGLITDTWPNHIQYRSATGFGCPDTAACDSQYYGLKNQIRNAAKMFRDVLNGGWTNYPVGQNYIRFHPNAACGGTIVDIKNRATSALYRYTPYQPNQAALAAGYGVGNGCSAYGNRNFYALFTDWFGSTTDIIWEAMSDPRWMSIKYNTKKSDLSNLYKIDDTLISGRQIRFVSKTIANGIVYLRTEWDDNHNYNKGIALYDLQEIPFIQIDEPRWMTITCNQTRKITPNSGKSSSEVFPKSLVANFTSKITVNGITYLRTETDTRAGNNLGFPISCVDTATTTNTLSFDKPRKLYIPKGSSFVDIRTGIKTTTQKNISYDFSRKFIFNGVTYYQTTQDFNANRLVGINGLSAKEHVPFIAMDIPRSLSLTHYTNKINLLNGSPTGDTIPAGTNRPFIDKFFYNGQWYLRTKNDYDLNLQTGIPLNLLR